MVTMSKYERSHDRGEEFPPRAGNASLTLVMGPAEHPVTFTFSSPHGHFAVGLNRIISLLPELEDRLSAAGAEPFAAEQSVRSTAVSTVATESDYLILADASSGAITVSLFSATKAGRTLVVCKVDNSANAVTVSCFGADTMEGSASKTLSSRYDKCVLTADGISTWIDEATGDK